jgi:outer membrane protein OmpA-like peptidoglycan-associated protein
MHKKVVLALSLLVLVGSVSADPALGGGRGIFRVYDARVEEDGALVFANRLILHRENSDISLGPLYGMEFSYAPYPEIEAFGSLLGVAELGTSPFSIRYDWQGYSLGSKLSFPYLPVAKLGLAGNWLIERKGRTEPDFMHSWASPGGYWRLLASFRFWELHKTLPTLMFNYGTSFSGDGAAFLGVGLELPSDALDCFIEASSEAPFGKGFFNQGTLSYITPGVRIRIPYFHINAGWEMSLTDSAPNKAILGFSLVSPFPKPKPKPYGQLAGRVEDARTGAPLAAQVKFLNRKLTPLKTDAMNGTFYMAKSPVGSVVIEASKDGYLSEAVPLVIPEFGYASYTFKLRNANPVGTVAGRVFDLASGRPIEAKVTVAERAPVTTSKTTGFFRVDNIPIGMVTVKIEKDGYIAEERVSEIEEAKASKLEVGLRPVPSPEPKVETKAVTPPPPPPPPVKPTEEPKKPAIFTIRGVVFDFNKATLRPEAHSVLMEGVKLLKDNPDIRVEVMGFTDDVGSEDYNLGLSERRAEAVVEFLVSEGISRNRLETRGYGESHPIASNDTEEGRAQNRRVEFAIVK